MDVHDLNRIIEENNLTHVPVPSPGGGLLATGWTDGRTTYVATSRFMSNHITIADVTQTLRTDQRAEEIASRRYGLPFGELPPHEQMTVWMEAEHLDVTDCPSYKNYGDGVGTCRENEGRSCEAELGRPCDEWLAFLRECRQEEKS